jgi:hypothetical protein
MRVWRTAGSSSSFRQLLDRLLVKEAVGEPFLLQNLIVPVALVDPPQNNPVTLTRSQFTSAAGGTVVNTAMAVQTIPSDGLYEIRGSVTKSTTFGGNRGIEFGLIDANGAGLYGRRYTFPGTAPDAANNYEVTPLRLFLKQNWQIKWTNTDALLNTEQVVVETDLLSF